MSRAKKSKAASASCATINPRSRTAKRAASPSINIDKSLKDTPRASDATPSLLSHRPQSGGITKPQKKAKPLKRGQRARQEKGLARAEVVMDQLEKKKSSYEVRVKRVRERRGVWDEINGAAQEEVRKTPKMVVEGAPASGTAESDADKWEDEDEDHDEQGDAEMKMVDGVEVPAFAPATKLVVADRTASVAGSDIPDLGEIT